jgi:hypothetical protein
MMPGEAHHATGTAESSVPHQYEYSASGSVDRAELTTPDCPERGIIAPGLAVRAIGIRDEATSHGGRS